MYFFKFQIIQVILQFKWKANKRIQSSFLEWGLLEWGGIFKSSQQNFAKVNLYVTHYFEICFTYFQIDFIQSGSLQESHRPLENRPSMLSNSFSFTNILNAGYVMMVFPNNNLKLLTFYFIHINV